MVWYVRFLKLPKLDQKGNVRALITVTTDLGDDFYHADLTLHAAIIPARNENEWISAWRTLNWRSGMRNLWIDIANVRAALSEDVRLVVNSKASNEGNSCPLNNIPEILGVWSGPFNATDLRAGNVIERRYRTNSGPERAITENTGESIARHIWDAGIVSAAFMSTLVLQPRATSDLTKLLQSFTPRMPRILELGSGCGIVGLQVADLCSEIDVLLTDLPDAMDILNRNIERGKFTSRSGTLAAAVLDWDEPLPETIAKQRFDLVIVSDCTYNDSMPGLVKTLSLVAKTSPDAQILVALKVRHFSEAIFFKLMANANFIESEHIAIPLPDRHRDESGQKLEVIHVYVFRKQSPVQHRG